MRSRLRISLGLCAALLGLTSIPALAVDSGPGVKGRADDAGINLSGQFNHGGGSGGGQSASYNGPVTVVVYIPACPGNAPSPQADRDALCATALTFCAAQGTPDSVLYWQYRAVQDAAGALGQWNYLGQVCRNPAEVAAAAVVPEFTLRDFQRLPLPPGGVHVQPANGRALVNVDTNVYVTAEPVTLTTTLIGFPIEVRATPVRYEWSFGDGHVLTTSDPGGAYPAMTTTHPYTAAGRHQITLRTFYTGEYSVAGGPWQDVDGEAVVTSDPATIDVIEARGHLVAGLDPSGD